MQKINYHTEYLNVIKELDGKKPTLLLHACCGPCSTQVLNELVNNFEVTMYFYNPNIHPKKEYEKRYQEIKNFVEKFNIDFKVNINFVTSDYDFEKYFEFVKGLEHLGERSDRCKACFELRLLSTKEKAKDYDYYTTTLTLSKFKDSQAINKIAKEMDDNKNYLFSDFAKEDGYNKSIEFSKKYDVYRQDYCGCIFSKKEMLKNKNV